MRSPAWLPTGLTGRKLPSPALSSHLPALLPAAAAAAPAAAALYKGDPNPPPMPKATPPLRMVPAHSAGDGRAEQNVLHDRCISPPNLLECLLAWLPGWLAGWVGGRVDVWVGGCLNGLLASLHAPRLQQQLGCQPRPASLLRPALVQRRCRVAAVACSPARPARPAAAFPDSHTAVQAAMRQVRVAALRAVKPRRCLLPGRVQGRRQGPRERACASVQRSIQG
jgi:hypothetical protein